MLAAPASLACKGKCTLRTQETTGQPRQPALPAQWFTAYSALSPVYRYLMHTSLLRRSAKTDSLMRGGLVEAILCRWKLGWAIWRSSPGKRGASLHDALVHRPGSCIRRLAGNRAQEVRFTRFLRNDRVSVAEMASHAASRTAARVAGREIIVVQDTSELILGGRRAKANGYGPVGKGGATRGLLLHAALALDAGNDALLGLVDAQVWNRNKGKVTPRRSRATTDKESQRWLSGAAQAGAALSTARSITVISDRESDIYEHFARRPANVELHCQGKLELEDQIEVRSFCGAVCICRWLTGSSPVQRDDSCGAGPQGADGRACLALLAGDAMPATSKPRA